jgi:phosphotransferase system IIB component
VARRRKAYVTTEGAEKRFQQLFLSDLAKVGRDYEKEGIVKARDYNKHVMEDMRKLQKKQNAEIEKRNKKISAIRGNRKLTPEEKQKKIEKLSIKKFPVMVPAGLIYDSPKVGRSSKGVKRSSPIPIGRLLIACGIKDLSQFNTYEDIIEAIENALRNADAKAGREVGISDRRKDSSNSMHSILRDEADDILRAITGYGFPLLTKEGKKIRPRKKKKKGVTITEGEKAGDLESLIEKIMAEKGKPVKKPAEKRVEAGPLIDVAPSQVRVAAKRVVQAEVASKKVRRAREIISSQKILKEAGFEEAARAAAAAAKRLRIAVPKKSRVWTPSMKALGRKGLKNGQYDITVASDINRLARINRKDYFPVTPSAFRSWRRRELAKNEMLASDYKKAHGISMKPANRDQARELEFARVLWREMRKVRPGPRRGKVRKRAVGGSRKKKKR